MDIREATRILGERRVLPAAATKDLFGVNQLVPGSERVRYSEATLRACNKENGFNGSEWRLVYIHPLSLSDLGDHFCNRGTDGECGRSHGHLTWLNRGSYWFLDRPVPGYYLIDLAGRFPRTGWDEQEKKIGQLGSGFERAREALVAQAAVAYRLARREILIENWLHWGPVESNPAFDRVMIGENSDTGLHLWILPRGRRDSETLRTCVARVQES